MPGLHIVVSATASDAHTWNLVFLQLLLEELGHRVTNLGPCVPDEVLLTECRRHRPDLVVISSVNGHGCHDGIRLIRRLRADPGVGATPAVIGGKLAVANAPAQPQRLIEAGFDAVFIDGDQTSIAALRSYTRTLAVLRSP